MGRLLTLPANILLGWKRQTNVNTLAYYSEILIMTVKIVQALFSLHFEVELPKWY
jgi:hypothetical protein